MQIHSNNIYNIQICRCDQRVVIQKVWEHFVIFFRVDINIKLQLTNLSEAVYL